ncbi:MAG TPA: ABC transporter permease [Candidatus Acidoferrum sp.]|nr:ABC transporter permease [Candidatus Acidoferrum sp.]
MLGRISSFFRNLLRKRAVEQALDDELQSAVEVLTQEKMKEGLSHPEGRREALIELGGVEQVKEEVRAIRSGMFLDTFAQDLRHALRILRKCPGFTTVAVLTLALGIGATTAMFSVVNGVLLKPLPYPHQERLVEVGVDLPGINQFNWPLSPPDYFTFREQSYTFEDIGLYFTGFGAAVNSVNVTGLGRPENVSALGVTDGVLPILGVIPVFGRSFVRADDEPGSPDTVIITYGYWRSKFAGDRSVIGKTIDVDGKPSTIIGVLPQPFRFLDITDLAILMPLRTKELRGYNYFAVARLKPGVTLEEANADVARMIPMELRGTTAEVDLGLKWLKESRKGPNLQPLKQDIIGDVGKVLWVLMGGIGLVLLIACANVANLHFVRVQGRQQELAIRAALGASPGRIAGGLLLESFVLTVIGGALGLLFAYGGSRILIALAPSGLPRLNDIGIDRYVLLFTLGVTMLAGLLFGSMLALRYAGVGLETGLRETGRSSSASRERHRARNALVVIQVGLALVLLMSSGLMIRTFQALLHVQPGFTEPAEVQTFRVHIPPTMVEAAPERLVRMDQAILHQIEALPGVSSADISQSLPMDSSADSGSLFVKDRMLSGQLPPACRFFWISPSFFRTMGIPTVAGRDLTWDDVLNKRPVAIVSENLAREYWHNPSDALGKQIGRNPNPDRQIVGVVANVYDDGTSQKAPATVYWPLTDADFSLGQPAFAIRSARAGLQSFMSEVRQAVWSLAPDLPLSAVHTLDYYYRKSMARVSFLLVMLSLAGGMALLLGAIGLYGVIAYSVSQRTREIGIRMALGGHREDILRLILGQGTKLALIGVATGIAAALGLSRFLSSLLFGVKPTDPLTFLGVTLVLVLVTLLACYIPARRAMRVDPLVALKYE